MSYPGGGGVINWDGNPSQNPFVDHHDSYMVSTTLIKQHLS